MKKSSNSLTKLVACMITKKEKSDNCLSIEVFTDFGINSAHSVNMGNENVEAVLPPLQIN